MAERKTVAKKLSTTNTKQEMLDSYNDLLAQLEEKRESNASSEQKVAEKAVKQTVAVADALSTEGIISDIGNLKAEMGKVLTSLSDKLEQEAVRYESVKKAIIEKENELVEIYEIQKSASSLSALIEAQALKKEEFEADMAERKENLTRDIEETKSEWQKEKTQRATELKEQEAAEARKRAREKEEFEYNIQRERQSARDTFEKEKTIFAQEREKLEREIALRREETEREFNEREQAIARQEQELDDMRVRVAAFPKELETTVAREVKSSLDKSQTEAKFRIELAQKEFEGERNVLTTRISSLEAMQKDQAAQIAKLMEQIEKSYSQVQDIAIKAVDGSAANKALSSFQQRLVEQGRSGEK